VVHPPLGKWIIALGIKLFDGKTRRDRATTRAEILR